MMYVNNHVSYVLSAGSIKLIRYNIILRDFKILVKVQKQCCVGN